MRLLNALFAVALAVAMPANGAASTAPGSQVIQSGASAASAVEGPCHPERSERSRRTI